MTSQFCREVKLGKCGICIHHHLNFLQITIFNVACWRCTVLSKLELWTTSKLFWCTCTCKGDADSDKLCTWGCSILRNEPHIDHKYYTVFDDVCWHTKFFSTAYLCTRKRIAVLFHPRRAKGGCTLNMLALVYVWQGKKMLPYFPCQWMKNGWLWWLGRTTGAMNFFYLFILRCSDQKVFCMLVVISVVFWTKTLKQTFNRTWQLVFCASQMSLTAIGMYTGGAKSVPYLCAAVDFCTPHWRSLPKHMFTADVPVSSPHIVKPQVPWHLVWSFLQQKTEESFYCYTYLTGGFSKTNGWAPLWDFTIWKR